MAVLQHPRQEVYRQSSHSWPGAGNVYVTVFSTTGLRVTNGVKIGELVCCTAKGQSLEHLYKCGFMCTTLGVPNNSFYQQIRTFQLGQDILASPHKFKVLLQGKDMFLRLRFELGLGQGLVGKVSIVYYVLKIPQTQLQVCVAGMFRGLFSCVQESDKAAEQQILIKTEHQQKLVENKIQKRNHNNETGESK